MQQHLARTNKKTSGKETYIRKNPIPHGYLQTIYKTKNPMQKHTLIQIKRRYKLGKHLSKNKGKEKRESQKTIRKQLQQKRN